MSLFRASYSFSFASWSLLVGALALSGCSGGGDEPDPGEGLGGAPGDSKSNPVVACEKDSDCADTVFCNGEEKCSDGVCAAGTKVDCSDGIECTIDRCDELSQECVSVAPDNDSDGHTDAECRDADDMSLGDDCDDSDAFAYPGAQEVCDADNRDEDCDPLTIGSRDADRDGYVDALCCNAQGNDEFLCGEDCDDTKPNVSPAATEACDFLDNNCDGEIDEGASVTMYTDADRDGRGDAREGTVESCVGAVGFTVNDGDCDDNDPEVFDGQFEICDGKDNNCNGEADEVQDQAPWYKDVDQDGYGDLDSTPVYSCYRIAGRVLSQNDCNDAEKTVNPNAPEICDGLDNDCNGLADFRLPGINNFEDDDGDGAADAACGGDDCDDHDPRTSGGAEEVCDRVDNDCDGEVDEQTVQNIWYIDEDGDGWGVVLGSAVASCDPVVNRATKYGDCDDSEVGVRPGQFEICDGIDQDCDGKIDEGASVHCSLDNAIPACRGGSCEIFSCVPGFADADNNPQNGCEAVVDPASLMTTQSCSFDVDCNDANLCNGIETCSGGFCRLGTPINCDAGPAVIQGNFTVDDGRDIRDLAGIEVITGDLIISGTSLGSLVGLESLKVVGGNLFITNNGFLRRLSGSALSSLEAVGGDLYVEGNDALVNVDLPSLISVNSLVISNNKSLLEIDGAYSELKNGAFENLVKVEERLVIEGNSELASVNGFNNLGRIGGLQDLKEVEVFNGVSIESNYQLSELDAFATLQTIEGSFMISWVSLESLSLPALQELNGHLELRYLNKLKSLDFPALASVDGNLLLNPGGDDGESQLETLKFGLLSVVGGTVAITDPGATLVGVELPALETAEAVNLVFFYPSESFDKLNFDSLAQVNSLTLDYYGSGPGIASFAFPSLSQAVDLSFYLQGDSISSIEFPELLSLGQANVSVYSGQTLSSVDFPKLVTVLSGFSLDVPTQSLDISQLVTIGGDTNDGELHLCTDPFYVCDELIRIEQAGYVGQADTCGLCEEIFIDPTDQTAF